MLSNLPLSYLLLFSGSFIFSLLINSLLLKFSRTLGIRNNPELQIRWSTSVKPAVGGISFYLTFLILFLLSDLLIENSSVNFSTPGRIAFLCSLTIAFLLGLSDDAFDTKPLIKFSTQFVCSIILILGGIKISCFESEFLNYAITSFWVVAVMNSYNMLDNMDAIATVTAMGIFTYFILADFSIHHSATIFSLIFCGILACLTGFLFYNWHPSKMFMGDTGSQFIGAFLAIGGINYCWNYPSTINQGEIFYFPFKNITLVYLIFLLPISDTLTVFLNRSLRGNSPFIGGKDHTTHHLFFKGITEKKIAILFSGIIFFGSFLANKVIEIEKPNLNTLLPYLIFPALTSISLYLTTVLKSGK